MKLSPKGKKVIDDTLPKGKTEKGKTLVYPHNDFEQAMGLTG